MIILAAHRILNNVSQEAGSRFLKNAPEYFDIVEFDPQTQRDEFLSAMKQKDKGVAIGAVLTGDPLRLLVLKDGVMDRLFGGEMAPELRALDVTVLKDLIFKKLIGLSEADLADHDKISFKTSAVQVIDDIASGKGDAAFILNSTRMEQVRAVARAGLTMPRKSTYFYPKVITGVVMNSLKPL